MFDCILVLIYAATPIIYIEYVHAYRHIHYIPILYMYIYNWQLIGQYLALRKSFRQPDPDPNYIGLVSLKCSVKAIASEAVRDATYMCK